MVRLRRSDPTKPGLTRKGRGKGFEYFDERRGGEKVTDPEVLDRIRSLAIPPAYADVWISPHHNGHLQAIGVDARGRKQYRYHPEWRRQKDLEKFDEMLEFARVLPKLRHQVEEILTGTDKLTRERVLAAGIRLLDRGFFRIGGEEYAEENESYGLATIRKDQVVATDDEVRFDYVAKGGKRRQLTIPDPELADVLKTLRRRRGGGDELLAWKEGGDWVDLQSRDVNAELKRLTGGDYSAKDFRTWNATVLAAVTLAVATPARTSKTAAKRAKAEAARQVATSLGNTPTVARNSYIDPRVFDRYDSGWTVLPALERLGEVDDLGEPAFHGVIEEAVLDLLEERREGEGVDTGAEAELLAAPAS